MIVRVYPGFTELPSGAENMGGQVLFGVGGRSMRRGALETPARKSAPLQSSVLIRGVEVGFRERQYSAFATA